MNFNPSQKTMSREFARYNVRYPETRIERQELGRRGRYPKVLCFGSVYFLRSAPILPRRGSAQQFPPSRGVYGERVAPIA